MSKTPYTIRVDDDVRKEFTDKCKENKTGISDVLETMMLYYIHNTPEITVKKVIEKEFTITIKGGFNERDN